MISRLDLYRQALEALEMEPHGVKAPWTPDQAIKRSAARRDLRLGIAEVVEAQARRGLRVVSAK